MQIYVEHWGDDLTKLTIFDIGGNDTAKLTFFDIGEMKLTRKEIFISVKFLGGDAAKLLGGVHPPFPPGFAPMLIEFP